MATHWSYDASAFADGTTGYYPGSTIGARNQIRLWLQDTSSSRQLFQDEEIDWQQTQEANAYMAAAFLCDMLVSRAGGIKSKRISDFYITYDTAYYQSLAMTLRARGNSYQVPYVGGISRADKSAQRSDLDWIPPTFGRGMGDNPDAPKPSTPSNPLTTI